MFAKCAACGYLTPEGTPLCKQCGAVVGAAPEGTPAATDQPAPTDHGDWLTTPPPMPPPDPSTAAPPRISVGPAPQASAPASMFPTADAKAPRRPIPTWSIASATVLVVAALIVGLLIASSGGDDTAKRRADAATAKVAAQRTRIDTAEQSLITRADLGSQWTDLGIEATPASTFGWNDPCSDDPALTDREDFGRNIAFSYKVEPNGVEHGHLDAVVDAYANAEQVNRGMTARRRPDFAVCIAKFDIDRIVSPGATDIVGDGVTRVDNPEALLFHETMRFAFRGIPQISAVWTAYMGHGAYRSVLTITGNFQPDYIAELVHVARQRFDTHTPG